MNLVVHLSYDTADESGNALSLARRAPTFAVEWVHDRKMAVATFPSLPANIDLAVELVGDAVRLPEAWASIDAVPISNLAKLWQRLLCYRDSLAAPDPARYCAAQAAHVQTLVGCEEHRCPVSCQFICQTCLHQPNETPSANPQTRFTEAAKSAEIGWCPRLRLPSPSDPPDALINPSKSNQA